MQPRSLQYCFSLKTISWNVGHFGMCLSGGFQNGSSDELAFDMSFEFAAPESGAGRPRWSEPRRRSLSCPIGRVQHLFGDARGSPAASSHVFRRSERAAAIVAVKPGAVTAEIRPLRMFRIFEPRTAAQANVQFRQQPCKPHRPQAEVRDGAPDAPGSRDAQMIEDTAVSSRKYFSLGSAAGSSCSETSAKKSSAHAAAKSLSRENCDCIRSQRVDVDQLAILAMKIRHLNMRKPLQTGTKSAFRPPRAARDTSQFAEIARQKTDDEIAFFERPGLQDEGFAHTSGHINCDARNFKVIMRPVNALKSRSDAPNCPPNPPAPSLTRRSSPR